MNINVHQYPQIPTKGCTLFTFFCYGVGLSLSMMASRTTWVLPDHDTQQLHYSAWSLNSV